MNIAICEDDREQREQIRAICTAYFAGEGETCQITEYVNGELLLQNLYQETELLFLDIELGEGKNGIAVMKELEQLRQVRKIVFISSHHEGVWDSFGWKTLGFVRKPFSRDDIIAFINPAKHIVVSAGLYWNSDCKYFWVVCDCMVFRMYTERDHPFTCMDAGVRMYRDCDVSVL